MHIIIVQSSTMYESMSSFLDMIICKDVIMDNRKYILKIIMLNYSINPFPFPLSFFFKCSYCWVRS